MHLLARSAGVVLIAAAVLLPGCDFLAVKEQQEKSNALCEVAGTVRAEKSGTGNLIVVLFAYGGGPLEQPASWRLADHFVLDQPGHWFFYVGPGKYGVTAFQDSNRDHIFERDEPAVPLENFLPLECGPGAAVTDLDLEIPEQGRIPGNAPVDISKLQARSASQQLDVALGQVLTVGKVVPLSDPRFSRKQAEEGLWRPFDFLWKAKPGVYFLEPFHPEKIPVLFIHGIQGTPLDFAYLIDGLDRARFQPWVAYYPSGGQLDLIGQYLDQIVTRLKSDYRPRKLIVVAHSMGGLVARSFILHHAESSTEPLIRAFVSLASPWNGHAAARLGVEYAPTPVQVWYDIAPGSRFLAELFYRDGTERRTLPQWIAFHLIFGFLPTESGDGTISLESQLRWEAQQEATRLYGISGSHTGILENLRTSELLNRILMRSAAIAD